MNIKASKNRKISIKYIIFRNCQQTLWGSIWDVYAITGQELLDAIKANKENYSFDCVTAPYVLYASPENPYITLMNIKEKK